MKLTEIIYVVILAFYLVDTRERRAAETVSKYYIGDSLIIMDCVPPSGADCSWATNTGNTYFMQSLPQNVIRNDSSSCTIRFRQPSSYDSQIWSCELDSVDGAFKEYQILSGSRPTAPTFQNKGAYLVNNDGVNWNKSIEIVCTTIHKGLPRPIYSIKVTGGVKSVKRITNSSIVLNPMISETEVNMTCTITQHFLPKPLQTSITLQLEDIPKALDKPVLKFDDVTKKQELKYIFVSNPQLTRSEWTFSNSSDNKSRTPTRNERRYTASPIFNEKLGQSLTLTIDGFNATDKKRFFFLELVNSEGSVLLGPLSSSGILTPSALLVLSFTLLHLGSSLLSAGNCYSTI